MARKKTELEKSETDSSPKVFGWVAGKAPDQQEHPDKNDRN
jgi:hypothetical protein